MKRIKIILLIVVLMLIFTINIYAVEFQGVEIPDYSDKIEGKGCYIIFYTKNNNGVYLATHTGDNPEFYIDSTVIKCNYYECDFDAWEACYNETSQQYEWYSRSSWQYSLDNTYELINTNGSDYHIFACSHDIYADNTYTDVFFSVPNPTLLQIQLPILQSNLFGQIQILLICSIGLLALVMGYKILPKVLQIFLH